MAQHRTSGHQLPARRSGKMPVSAQPSQGVQARDYAYASQDSLANGQSSPTVGDRRVEKSGNRARPGASATASTTITAPASGTQADGRQYLDDFCKAFPESHAFYQRSSAARDSPVEFVLSRAGPKSSKNSTTNTTPASGARTDGQRPRHHHNTFPDSHTIHQRSPTPHPNVRASRGRAEPTKNATTNSSRDPRALTAGRRSPTYVNPTTFLPRPEHRPERVLNDHDRYPAMPIRPASVPYPSSRFANDSSDGDKSLGTRALKGSNPYHPTTARPTAGQYSPPDLGLPRSSSLKRGDRQRWHYNKVNDCNPWAPLSEDLVHEPNGMREACYERYRSTPQESSTQQESGAGRLLRGKNAIKKKISGVVKEVKTHTWSRLRTVSGPSTGDSSNTSSPSRGTRRKEFKVKAKQACDKLSSPSRSLAHQCSVFFAAVNALRAKEEAWSPVTSDISSGDKTLGSSETPSTVSRPESPTPYSERNIDSNAAISSQQGNEAADEDSDEEPVSSQQSGDRAAAAAAVADDADEDFPTWIRKRHPWQSHVDDDRDMSRDYGVLSRSISKVKARLVCANANPQQEDEREAARLASEIMSAADDAEEPERTNPLGGILEHLRVQNPNTDPETSLVALAEGLSAYSRRRGPVLSPPSLDDRPVRDPILENIPPRHLFRGCSKLRCCKDQKQQGTGRPRQQTALIPPTLEDSPPPGNAGQHGDRRQQERHAIFKEKTGLDDIQEDQESGSNHDAPEKEADCQASGSTTQEDGQASRSTAHDAGLARSDTPASLTPSLRGRSSTPTLQNAREMHFQRARASIVENTPPPREAEQAEEGEGDGDGDSSSSQDESSSSAEEDEEEEGDEEEEEEEEEEDSPSDPHNNESQDDLPRNLSNTNSSDETQPPDQPGSSHVPILQQQQQQQQGGQYSRPLTRGELWPFRGQRPVMRSGLPPPPRPGASGGKSSSSSAVAGGQRPAGRVSPSVRDLFLQSSARGRRLRGSGERAERRRELHDVLRRIGVKRNE